MNNKGKKWITIVELIVVITILAILWTVGFLSFQSYTVYSRDVVRVTDLKNIQSVLEYTYTESWVYPLPDTWTWITFSGWLVWTQWEFWKDTKRKTKRLDKIPLDPLTQNEYTYSVLNTNLEFELWAILEWDEIAKNSPRLGGELYADNSDFKSYITWNYNWLVAKVNTWSKDYVLAVPSIISWDITSSDLLDIVSNQDFSLKWYKNIPHSYGVTNTESPKPQFVNPDNLVVWSWSVDELKYNIRQLEFLDNLQLAYTWTTIKDNSEMKFILSPSADDEKSFASQTIIKAGLNKKIVIDEYLSLWTCTFPFIVWACSYE